ncbi:hypothetical protein [Serratia ficaria]|uniref:hypothetical protein n=1 Tax=Serratia ficaria TaxID=61651 RepID=UPI000A836FA7|nr:hypothetical protein [Serratia ficaria]
MSIYDIDIALGVPTLALEPPQRKKKPHHIEIKRLLFSERFTPPPPLPAGEDLPRQNVSPDNDDLSQSNFYRTKSKCYMSQTDDKA